MGGDAPLMMIDCVALMSCNHRNDTTTTHMVSVDSYSRCGSAPSLRTVPADDGRA